MNLSVGIYVNTIVVILVCLLALVPVLTLYILHKNVVQGHDVSLSGYGIIILIYLFTQSIFSYINYLHYKKLDSGAINSSGSGSGNGSCSVNKKIVLVVVGYREDPVYFKNCVQAASELQGIHKIIYVIDGNDPEDEDMAKITEAQELHLSTIGSVGNDVVSLLELDECKSLCILQPHDGKRSALYTGIKAALSLGADAVMLTDSDTIINQNTAVLLSQALFENNSVGAVTGDVEIFNVVNTVTFLASVKYWFAFNVERGAQSFFGSVTCVSGPLGMYKADVLNSVLEDWYNQTFLGAKCSYGDDRHLTNLVLSLGKQVKCTPLAVCHTESPQSLNKWILQQIRWSKSFFREFLFNVKSFHKQSPWMAAELMYQVIYPFLVVYTIFNVLIRGSTTSVLFWMIIVLSVGHVRGIIGAVCTRNPDLVFYSLVNVLYVLFSIPIKVYAALSLPFETQGWMTTPRSQKQGYNWKPLVFIGLWISSIVGLIVRNVLLHSHMKSELNKILGLTVVCVLIVEYIVSWIMVARHSLKSKQHSHQEISEPKV